MLYSINKGEMSNNALGEGGLDVTSDSSEALGVSLAHDQRPLPTLALFPRHVSHLLQIATLPLPQFPAP